MVIMTMLQITRISHRRDSRTRSHGFTLFELIVVLAIIAAMITVAIPYASRSNESLRIKQECLNVAQAIEYASDLAVNIRRPTRIVINPNNKSYWLEIAAGTNNHDYKPLEDFQGSVRYFGKSIYITDTSGFSIDGNTYYLIFDPARPWPNASISLSNKDAIKTIIIRGNHVEIEESSI